MLKLIFLLLLPGGLAEFVGVDRKKDFSVAKSIVHSLYFGYILFLADVTAMYTFFSMQYEEFLKFLSRRIHSVEDVSLFTLLLCVQLFVAFGLGMFTRILRYRDVERAVFRMGGLQKNGAALTLGVALIVAVVTFVIKDSAQRQLVINEVCSRNDRVITDENGNYPDYIEIYNPSKWSILLDNYKIADAPDGKDGVDLEEVILLPGSLYLVWVGQEDANDKMGISSGGENLYLLSPAGEVMDKVAVPKLEANTAYARSKDGEKTWQVEVPSPLEPNDPKKKYLDKPVFSAESGFYEEEFLLQIQGKEGERIYYTLDSSIPNENSMLYTEEILIRNLCEEPNVYTDIPNIVLEWDKNAGASDPVDKAFVVRAIAMDEEGNTSDVVTKTYFVDMEEYREEYVLSLVSDPEDLFGDNGIYVTGKAYDDWYLGITDGYEPLPNFELRGREAEIDTAVGLFQDTLLMEQQAGLRIQGGSERSGTSKRFSVFARKEYSGNRFFEYDLFGQKMHAFFMRPDFEDAFVQSLVTDRNVGTLKAIPAVVFLNGEHWYNTYLREKYNEDFLAFTYNVDSKNVRLEEGIPQEIYSFLEEHDLSKEADFEQFCDMIDLQSYIDHLAINIYLCNMDASEYKNYRIWKTTTDTGEGYNDGKWRWLLYDMDCLSWNSIGYYGAMRHDIDSFAHDKEYAGVAYNQERVYKALRVNETFCRQFVLTFMDLANTNFAAEIVEEQITDWGRDMDWNDGFFAERFEGIMPALVKEFQLKGTLEEITLSMNVPDAGFITINTATPKLKEGSWTGRYYTDYPVTITAIANEGYEFVGWKNEGLETDEVQITVPIEKGGCEWEAVFKKKERD